MHVVTCEHDAVQTGKQCRGRINSADFIGPLPQITPLQLRFLQHQDSAQPLRLVPYIRSNFYDDVFVTAVLLIERCVLVKPADCDNNLSDHAVTNPLTHLVRNHYLTSQFLFLRPSAPSEHR